MQTASKPTLYARIGGDPVIAELVDRLYYWMVILPEAREVWAMHHSDLDDTKARLRAFLSTWFGGPDQYSPAYGDPFMRRRHMPFAIGPAERDVWLLCLRRALADVVKEPELRSLLDSLFSTMAEHMRNRDDSGAPLAPSCGCGGRCAA